MMWGLDEVVVRLGGTTVLDRVSLPASPASVSVVVGGDGAGKSTCLRALVGTVVPVRGTVRRPSKARTGYVPATTGFYADMTVTENIAFFARAFGLSGPGLDRRSVGLVERAGLAEARGRLGGRLSGGMQRKLAVVLALLHKPELLVLDEPTTGVDPVSRVELWKLVSAAAADGTAVVVATTYVNEAARAGWVTLLGAGRVLATGHPSDILGAVPGSVGAVAAAGAPPRQPAWRRGPAWRVWAPDGHLPEGAALVEPDFEDAVVVAELAALTPSTGSAGATPGPVVEP